MNANEFRKNLVVRFLNGASEMSVKDGFYVLNCKDLKVSLTNDCFSISNDKADRSEIIIADALQDFMKNLKIGMIAAGLEIPAHIQEALDNDVDFSDAFVSDVFENI